MPARKIRGSWYVDFRWDGRRTRTKSPVDSQQGARAFELELREELLKFGCRGKPLDMTFDEWCDIWIREKVEPDAKRSGLRTKRSILRVHLLPRFGHRRLREIDAASIDGLMADLRVRGLSKKTVNNIVSVLHTALVQARRRKLLHDVPSVEFLSADRPPFRFLEAEEAERLVSAAPPGLWREMILFALHTGLRANELLALEWTHLDMTRRLATVMQGEVDGHLDSTKTDRVRWVPLSDDVMAALRSLPRTSVRVFPMPPVRFPYHHALDVLKAISKDAGIEPPITWHPLRHTFATLALAGGAPLTVVRDVLGHTTIEMTNEYAHVARNMLHTATDALPRLSSALGPWLGTGAVSRDHVAPEPALRAAVIRSTKQKPRSKSAAIAWSG